MASLSLRHIYFERQYRWILEDISFELEGGQLLFVAGDNGSGKTSLLRISSGLVLADKGEIFWNERAITSSLAHYHQDICYVGHKDGIKDDLSVAENLQLIQALAGVTRKASASQKLVDFLQAVGLVDQHALVATLSAGQKRRLALARCLIGRRTLWILDEPFTALDQSGIQLFQQHLNNHLDDGGMVMMASHQAVNLPGQNVVELNLNR